MQIMAENVELRAKPVGPLGRLNAIGFEPALARRGKPERDRGLILLHQRTLGTGHVTKIPAGGKAADMRCVEERATRLLMEYYRTRRDWRKLLCTLPDGGSLMVADLCEVSQSVPKRKR